MSALLIVGPKCMLAASHAVSHVEFALHVLLRFKKMGHADGRTRDRYITLTVRRGQHNN